MMYYRIDSN